MSRIRTHNFMVIAINCIGSYKSNNDTIMTMTDLLPYEFGIRHTILHQDQCLKILKSVKLRKITRSIYVMVILNK